MSHRYESTGFSTVFPICICYAHTHRICHTQRSIIKAVLITIALVSTCSRQHGKYRWHTIGFLAIIIASLVPFYFHCKSHDFHLQLVPYFMVLLFFSSVVTTVFVRNCILNHQCRSICISLSCMWYAAQFGHLVTVGRRSSCPANYCCSVDQLKHSWDHMFNSPPRTLAFCHQS